MVWKKQISQEVLSTTDRSRRRSAGNSCAVRASGAIWGYRASGRMLERRLGALSQYKMKNGLLHEVCSFAQQPIFLWLRENARYGRHTKRTSSVSGEGDGSSDVTATSPMRSRHGGEDVLIAFTIP